MTLDDLPFNGIIIYFQLTHIMRVPVISVHSVGNLQIVDDLS